MSEYGCDICGGLGYTVRRTGKRRAGEQNLQMRDHPPKQDAHGAFWAGRSAGQLHIRDIPNAGVLATGRKTGGGEVFDRLEGQVVFHRRLSRHWENPPVYGDLRQADGRRNPCPVCAMAGRYSGNQGKGKRCGSIRRSHAAAENRPCCCISTIFSRGA